MAYYRLYFLDQQDRHIVSFEEFEAAGDADAVATSTAFKGGSPMELWNGGCQVRRFRTLAEAAAG